VSAWPDRPVRLAVLALAAVASAIVYLREDEGDGEPAGPRLALGYYVRDAVLQGTGDDGRVLYRVAAADARQVDAGGAIVLADVRVDYTPTAGVPWELVATQGQMPPDRTIIELSGTVVATAREAGSPPLSIRTDYLELDPEAYVARTDRGVLVERARDTLRARGMRAYLKEDRLELETDVQGTFRR
jgi:lipopolysaccharide export system protein LptC